MTAQTAPPATTTGWTRTGDLPWPRAWDHLQEGPVLLHDGRVLAAGGGDSRGAQTFADTALYDPATGQWTGTGPLTTSRRGHTLTTLDDGRVLAVGGGHGHPTSRPWAQATAELYDPATGTWTPTGSLHQSRLVHSATLLPDGRVLVAGGSTDQPPHFADLTTATAELYDPATGTWTPAAPMLHARAAFPAVLTPDGHVMAIGGSIDTGSDVAGITFCETYDPATDQWTPTDPIGTPTQGSNSGLARVNAQAVPLDDGSILLTGGHQGGPFLWAFSPFSLSDTERFDPTTRRGAPAAPMGIGRDQHRLIKLGSGHVLAIGGLEYGGFDTGYQHSETYDPATGHWGPRTGLTVPRARFGAVRLADDRVLIAGGAAQLAGASPTGDDILITSTDLFSSPSIPQFFGGPGGGAPGPGGGAPGCHSESDWTHPDGDHEEG
ncbi:protein LivK [Amycolatopsis sp. OK19-0408]|uniref:Protein LivK n=1 Tax=Amycolatopsis iheyensis TaxID=2945988 RepID=A0A9X2N7P3_9PSEU|nr:kelch repeat-containing protein [Amycolatopsis iheyensis]MCR6482368.1 protein LivK [Amycolatopsis iheyensis]